MAIVPSTAQFRADTTGVTVEQLCSELTNSRAAFFTMADIAQSAGPTTNNTVYGLNAFENNISGVNNTAIGSEAFRLNQIGSYSTAVGQASMYSNVSGQNNTALGSFASFANTIGDNNTAVGQGAMQNNQSGSNNTAVGRKALFSTATDSPNTALGDAAGRSLVFGAGNTMVGRSAMEYEGSGNNNTVVGHFATSLSGDNSIILGAGAYSVASNQLAIGSTSFPVGTFTPYTGAAAEYWDVYINGQTKRIMLAP